MLLHNSDVTKKCERVLLLIFFLLFFHASQTEDPFTCLSIVCSLKCLHRNSSKFLIFDLATVDLELIALFVLISVPILILHHWSLNYKGDDDRFKLFENRSIALFPSNLDFSILVLSYISFHYKPCICFILF